MDKLTQQQRSALMSRVKTKGTAPEMIVRSLIHRLGYRFRLHRKDLPGTPDLVFPSLQKIVFVHGCFWHGHSCSRGAPPSSNQLFWELKIAANCRRDKTVVRKLRGAGWSILIVWECQISDKNKFLQRVINFLG